MKTNIKKSDMFPQRRFYTQPRRMPTTLKPQGLRAICSLLPDFSQHQVYEWLKKEMEEENGKKWKS